MRNALALFCAATLLVVGGWTLAWIDAVDWQGMAALVRPPAAVALAPPVYRLALSTTGRLTQRGAFYTRASWRETLGWYADRLDLELDRKPRLRGGCLQSSNTEAWAMVREHNFLTLCERTGGTLIIVEHIVAWHW
jgi:hypothetical protein